MYDDIKKPQLLKNIPMVFIRALPALYYYSRYAKNNMPEKPKQIFQSHLEYLSDALSLLKANIELSEIDEIINDVNSYKTIKYNNRLAFLETITIKLSKFFNQHKQELKPVVLNLRNPLIDLYNQNIVKIRVLLIDNNNEPEKIKKLQTTLQTYCNYETEQVSISSKDYANKILDADFVLYASTYPPEIHEQVKDLLDFQRPGLAVAFIDKAGQVDQQAIRHGAQLLKTGFPVLFKVFTPIRLFTSIDKIYMIYHLDTA